MYPSNRWNGDTFVTEGRWHLFLVLWQSSNATVASIMTQLIREYDAVMTNCDTVMKQQRSSDSYNVNKLLFCHVSIIKEKSDPKCATNGSHGIFFAY